MILPEMMVSSNLLDEFKTCTLLQYSGKLDIKTAKGTLVCSSGKSGPCAALGMTVRSLLNVHQPQCQS